MTRSALINNLIDSKDKVTPRLPKEKLFFYYSIFMSFPAIQIFQNISAYIFLLIVLHLIKNDYHIFTISKYLQKLVLIFAFGALVSTIHSYFVGGTEYLLRALIVLPNYFYWTFLIIFFINFNDKLNYALICKGLSIGLVLSTIYFFFIQNLSFISAIPFFGRLTQNTFAFLLICFSPITTFYLGTKYGKIYAVIAMILFSLIGFTSGSRSGSILVFAGTILTIYMSGKVNFLRTISIISISSIIVLLISTDTGRDIIFDLNPRSYELVYNTQSTFETDRSYLVRRALIDKGIDIFNKYPITGIGLNNFAAFSGNIEGDFIGSEFVINKNIYEGKSAHNSYLSLLSEGGLLLFVPFILLTLTLLAYPINNLFKLSIFQRSVFIAVLMMLIHLYFISALLNVFAWFLLGLASSLVYKKPI